MSFTNFPRLSQELQDLIWAEAAAIQYQHIADTQTEVCTDPHAERQRQAIVGYDDLPDSIERQPLRLYVYASHDTDELRLVANEAQTLANCLPMATVCVDARKYAVELCLSRIKLMNLLHVVEDPIPDGTQILDPVFPQLTTVMVMTARSHPEDAPEGFDSVEHCVDVISRVFGSNVQKIIWNNWSQSGNSLSDIYWPHTSLIDGLEIMDSGVIDTSGHDQPKHFMTPDHVLHIEPEIFDAERAEAGCSWYEERPLYWHCLKISELLDASAKKLPQLQHVEVELHNSVWGKIKMIRLETTLKDGNIWIDRHNFHFGGFHYFFSSI